MATLSGGGVSLETKESIDLHDERTVVEGWKAGRQRVAFLVVHHKELAAWPVLPPESRVGRHGVRSGVVLQQGAHEHQRRHRVGQVGSHGSMPAAHSLRWRRPNGRS